jgi:large subunit ribosomal protein L31
MVIWRLFPSICARPWKNDSKRNIENLLDVWILANSKKEKALKTTIHPELHLAHITCSTCGTQLTTRWAGGDSTVETCSQCHPAYTGRAPRVTGGSRIERFERRRAAALQ